MASKRISFAEFSKLVPTETLTIIKKYMAMGATNSRKQGMVRKLLLAMEPLYGEQVPEIYSKLARKSGEPDYLEEEDFAGIFPSFSELQVYFNPLFYCFLTPVEVLANLLKEQESYTGWCSLMEVSNDDIERLKKIDEIVKENFRHQYYERKIDTLSIEVYDYLKSASKIRELLLNNTSRVSDETIAQLSLLFALSDVADTKNGTFGVLLKNLFDSKSVNLRSPYSFATGTGEVTVSEEAYDCRTEDICAIGEIFSTFYPQSNNLKNISIIGIVANVLKKGGIEVENFLHTHGLKQQDFFDIQEEIEHPQELLKEQFLENVNGNAYKLFERAYRIYILMKNEPDYNSLFTPSAEELATMAIFLATYHFGLGINKFLDDFELPLVDILSYLNINFSEEQIGAIRVNHKELTSIFYKFMPPISSTTDYAVITPETVANYVCGFNDVIRKVFNKLSPSKNFKTKEDFAQEVIRYTTNERDTIQRDARNKFFYGLAAPVEDFLEHLNNYKNVKIENADENMGRLILMLAALGEADYRAEEALRSLGLDEATLRNLFTFKSINRATYESELDFEFLVGCLSLINGAKECSTYEEIGIKLLSNLTQAQVDMIKINSTGLRKEIPEGLKKFRAIGRESLGEAFSDAFERPERLNDLKNGKNKRIKNFIIFHGQIAEMYPDLSEAEIVKKVLLYTSLVNEGYISKMMEWHGISVKPKDIGVGEYLSTDTTNLLRNDDDINTDPYDTYDEYVTLSSADFARRIFKEQREFFTELGISPAMLEILECEINSKLSGALSVPVEERIRLISEVKAGEINIHSVASILNFDKELLDLGCLLEPREKGNRDSDIPVNYGDWFDEAISSIKQLFPSPTKKGIFAKKGYSADELHEIRRNLSYERSEHYVEKLNRCLEKLSAAYTAIMEQITTMEAYVAKNGEFMQKVGEKLHELSESAGNVDSITLRSAKNLLLDVNARLLGTQQAKRQQMYSLEVEAMSLSKTISMICTINTAIVPLIRDSNRPESSLASIIENVRIVTGSIGDGQGEAVNLKNAAVAWDELQKLTASNEDKYAGERLKLVVPKTEE